MRTVSMRQPFVGGMITDRPAYEIGPQNSVFAQDGFSPQGFFRMRGGWSIDGTTADVADNLVTIGRTGFALADVTKTYTGDDDGDLFEHNSAAAGTSIYSGTVPYLARCVYGDEVLFCAQDGQTPLIRWAGVTGSFTDSPATWTADKATITATSSNFGTPEAGMFYVAETAPSPRLTLSFKIIEAPSTTKLTMQDAVADATTVPTAAESFPSNVGTTFPCVAVYNAGTISRSTDTITGDGTVWTGGAWGTVVASNDNTLAQDALLVPDGFTSAGVAYNYAHSNITDVASATSLTSKTTFTGEVPYMITRRCPFKDAANHKGSLWGTGVAQYPNRVYVSPPNWNPSFPPGGTLPFDPTDAQGGAGAEFIGVPHTSQLLDFIDVPTPYDGDHNVALLPSPNHLWVLKREKAFGIYGSFGGLDVSRDPIGPGCIDIRSAIAVAEGSFWASEDDVYWAPGQSAQPLMAGKIAREWRALTRDFDFGTLDYVTCGVASGHLIVHITTSGGTTQRTYLCDLRDQSWQSRITNFNPRYMFTSRLPGEEEKLLAVSNDNQGRVIDFATALDGSPTAHDDDGGAPRLQAWTTTALGRADGVEGIARLVDLDVHANVVDPGAAGSTSMAVSVVSGGGIGNPADATKTLADINSDTVDRIDRHHRRVARKGRFHQVRFDVDTSTDNVATKAEIHQIDAVVKDLRKRSR